MSKCRNVMVSVAVILVLAVAAQILSFSLPGWSRWSPTADVFANGSSVAFKGGETYVSGLWVQCLDGSLKNCEDWVQRSIDLARKVGECTRDTLSSMSSRVRMDCREYNNIELTMWVTQTVGLFLLVLALLAAILSSVAYCCGGCCGDYCIGFCKFFVLLVSMLSAMSITSGLVPFGVQYAEDKHRLQITRESLTFSVKNVQLYYSFELSALAAILALIAAIVAAFSKTHDGKISAF